MLLFNSSGRAACHYFSIRPMLLFNSVAIREGIRKLKFQYITCCYSTNFFGRKEFDKLNFNTSHVVIQPFLYNNKIVRSEYYNTFHVIIQQALFLFHLHLENFFQYIPCYYSTLPEVMSVIFKLITSIHPMLLFNQRKTVILASY